MIHISEHSGEHRTRQLILKMIKDEPGLSFGEILRHLGINKGTLQYHLHYLEKRNLIITKKKGKKRLYYGSSPGMVLKESEAELPRVDQRILNIIKGDPGIGVPDITRMTDLPKAKIYRRVQLLKERHLIMEVRSGSGVGFVYVTREKLAREMLLDLAERMIKGEIDRDTFFRMKKMIEEME